MGQGARKHRMTIGVLKLDRQLQRVTRPGDRHAQPEPDGEARVSCRKALDPQRVPSTAQDEELPANGLYRVGEQGNVDAGAERVWRGIHDCRLQPADSPQNLRFR